MDNKLFDNNMQMWTSLNPESILKVELKDGKLLVDRGRPSDSSVIGLSSQPFPDIRFRDVYGVKDGSIVLEKTIRARYIPPTEGRYEYDEEHKCPNAE